MRVTGRSESAGVSGGASRPRAWRRLDGALEIHMMGTNGRVPAHASRAGENTGAASRLDDEAMRAGAPEETVKESQTVLITLLSCRV